MKNKKIPIIIIVIIAVLVFSIIEVEKIINKPKYENELKSISYKIPNKFEKTSDFGDSRFYHYYSDNIGCSFRVYSNDAEYTKIKDGKEYLESRIYVTLKDKVSDIEEIDLNDYKWHYMSVENDRGITYYYATLNEDKIYSLEYEINDYLNGDGSNNYCLKQKDKIISSVKIK